MGVAFVLVTVVVVVTAVYHRRGCRRGGGGGGGGGRGGGIPVLRQVVVAIIAIISIIIISNIVGVFDILWAWRVVLVCCECWYAPSLCAVRAAVDTEERPIRKAPTPRTNAPKSYS